MFKASRYGFIALCLFATQPSWAKPAEIILLRHAEKLPDDQNPNLSPRGVQRSLALPALLSTLSEATNHGAPAAIFAARPVAHAPSRRCLETIEPTAHEFHLSIQTPYPATQFTQLAKELMTNHAYDGRTVIVCWVHDEIPALARALGVRKVPAWSGKTFDRLWCLDCAGDKTILKNIPQHLLPGDS